VEELSKLELRPGQVDERSFRYWLGSLLATESRIPPTAESTALRLGSGSPGCRLALAAIGDLWRSAALTPEGKLKRSLWAKLLRTAFGTQFTDDDSLFIEHTYLVLIATLIAHVVIGFDASELQGAPAVALSGQLFSNAGIRGVGEAGFFDWVLDVEGGDVVVSDLARRLSTFDWSAVDHDILKVLYQSVIASETRKRLGEYYTPDWLATRMVVAAVREPLIERVLDPACGSGTFLFHAVRSYLKAAETVGLPLDDALAGTTSHVFGIDLHPVAVVLAQVTYLLAIGTTRLAQASAPLSIPVYLGDSMRWEASEETFLSPGGEVVINTGEEQTMFSTEELRFPASIVSDPSQFDRLVDALASLAADRKPGDPARGVGGVLSTFGLGEADRRALEATYGVLCRLHDEGRDHIWGFYVRNQARPTWFAAKKNRVDVLIGNPPWLYYRFMPLELQKKFRDRAKARHLWAGGRVATSQDLAAFFVARSVELYLRIGGQFGFVMPLATLLGEAYEGFREGNYSSAAEECAVSFKIPWDLERIDPAPFPVPSCVVFGQRAASSFHKDRLPMPSARLAGSGEVASATSAREPDGLTFVLDREAVGPAARPRASASRYGDRFRQGAALVPRMLVLVVEDAPGPLPVPKTLRAVHSRRGSLEKRPWSQLPDQTGKQALSSRSLCDPRISASTCSPIGFGLQRRP
jgi:SAM-dependent methyltransferase